MRKMMDERQQNISKAVLAAGIMLVFILVLAFSFLIPIYEYQKEQIIKENCPEGLENCTVIIEPSMLWMLLGMPSVIVYFVTFQWLESKRIKTWRSYK